ncbi:hypothetical protein [Paracoccus endophyticus]|uniref:hypothetical protein n=1 Tax=Paracoccus endophyticus TaxID=2233774 RepID=UPI000DD673A8|nr:hypothetical protein [Paracoccus endophyticus]
MIPGNHDWYGWRLDDDEGLRQIVEGCGVNFAPKRVIEIGAYRFLCCRLWSDFRLSGDFIGTMRAVQDGLADYDRITIRASPRQRHSPPRGRAAAPRPMPRAQPVTITVLLAKRPGTK